MKRTLNHDVTAEELGMDSADPDEGWQPGDVIGPAGSTVSPVDDDNDAPPPHLIRVTDFANDPDADGYIDKAWLDPKPDLFGEPVLVEVVVECAADLVETWVLRVTPAKADEILADHDQAFDWLGSEATVSVEDTKIDGERERNVRSVTVLDGTSLLDALDRHGDVPLLEADRLAQLRARAYEALAEWDEADQPTGDQVDAIITAVLA